MPSRFAEVDSNLFRGGAPTPEEVKILKDVYGIKQIISLDKQSADRIDETCKENGINHIVIPIEGGINDGSKIIKNVGAKAIVNNTPSYIHCYHGKDRTGAFVAKYRIENGWSIDDAINEALSFGFGSGMDPETVRNYTKIITNANIHLNNNYKLCESCGMLKENICKFCEKMTKDIKKLSGNNIVENSKEEPECYHAIDDAGDNRVVSDLLNVPERIDNFASSYFRQSIIKYLLKKQLQKDAIYQNRVTFKVPMREKKKAKLALNELNELAEKTLTSFIDHLDLMYEPFTEYSGITPEQASEATIHINNFASVVEENLTKVKKSLYKVMKLLEEFDSDTKIYSMLNSLDDSINMIDLSVTSFSDILLNKKESTDFQENAIKAIEIVKKEIAQLKQLITESITSYIKDNVIMENWTTEIEEEIKEEEKEQEE